MTKKNPVVDIGICSLCKGCMEVAPEVFRYNKELNFIEVIDLKEYPVEKIDEAIKLCPVQCISWDE